MTLRPLHAAAVAAAFLALSTTAQADTRVEARRHFKAGMAMIAEGHYDEGVDELLQAYAVRPHPSVLFNIGKACEASGRTADAAAYYRRYLEANPPDAAEVRQALERLEVQLAKLKPEPAPPFEVKRAEPERPSEPVSTARAHEAPSPGPKRDDEAGKRRAPSAERQDLVPPPARSPEAASPGPKRDDEAGRRRPSSADRQEPVPAPARPHEAASPGTKRDDEAGRRRALPGERKAERSGEGALEPVSAPDSEDPSSFYAPYEETVVAASRRAQSALEAPNAITVITGEEIRASGLTSLPEILRRVPGAEVMTEDYSSSDVSFRGFNQRISNKVLVLVDGRPEYQDFLGLTPWSAMTIGLEEIERVEVIRGPGSALYGANAMMGVINIITRAPGSGPPAQLAALWGNGGVGSGSAVLSGGDRLRYRLSGGYTQADKYSRDYADNRTDMASTATASDPSLSLRSARANGTFFFAFDRDHSVALAGGVNRIYSELYASGLLRNFLFDGVNAYAKLDVSAAPVKLRLFWNTFSASAGPQYEPIGQRSMAMQVDSNILDGELFYQKSFELAGAHVLAAGVSTRLKNIAWTYVDSPKQELHGAGFIQEDWQPAGGLSFVASYRIDGHPLLNQGKPGFAQSPRVSAVVTPAEGHALRASFATAFRAPTFLESYLDLKTAVPGVNGASLLTAGNTALRPERLTSFEIGYRGEAARSGLSWDLAIYWNVVKDLIVLSAATPMDAGSAYDPSTNTFLVGRSQYVNDPQVYTARGGELGLTWNALEGLDLRASAAVQSVASNTASSVCEPCTEAPALKLNGGFIYRRPSGLDLSADFSFVSSTIWVEREPSASDLTQVSLQQNPLSAYVVLNARLAYRFFDDRMTASLVGSQLGADHQEHPFGNRISRRIFATLTVQP